jgi:hypothetical protein
MKIKLSVLRKIIREEVYRNNFWYGMSGMNVGGAGLNKPSRGIKHGGPPGLGSDAPPGLGDDTETELENEEQETYEEKAIPTRRG